MGAMRATWTDERMDDLNGRVDELARRMDRQFEQVGDKLEKMEERTSRQLERLDSKIDAFQLAIIRVGGGLIVTMAIGFGGLLAS